ncbi:hypothetical protein KEU06_21845 [Pseudaminobacter sp. 19-2017]|uniref:Uncharacterized protein n=1 Tax=Pseudaminobacter soli (ex Zhang et al. 2022) TaxID=2831468 RepID=A0A942I4C4_9HYPH|nr:hypothetical protein [Pseudaminobacter soli]MBS3651259.1 hypothetical protein [Pseudaminobacter soli]
MPDDIAGKPAPMPWPEALSWCVNAQTGRFKHELVRSLKSNDSRAAERAALPLIAEAQQLVDLARKALVAGPPTELDAQTLAHLALAHEAKLLAADEELRSKGLGLDLARGLTRPDGLGMSDEDLGLYQRAIAYLNDVSRSEAAKMRGGEALQLALDRALEERGIVLHPDDPAWRQLELGFIQAQRRAINGINARLDGELVPTPIIPAQPNRAETLSEAMRRWVEGAVGRHVSPGATRLPKRSAPFSVSFSCMAISNSGRLPKPMAGSFAMRWPKSQRRCRTSWPS